MCVFNCRCLLLLLLFSSIWNWHSLPRVSNQHLPDGLLECAHSIQWLNHTLRGHIYPRENCGVGLARWCYHHCTIICGGARDGSPGSGWEPSTCHQLLHDAVGFDQWRNRHWTSCGGDHGGIRYVLCVFTIDLKIFRVWTAEYMYSQDDDVTLHAWLIIMY